MRYSTFIPGSTLASSRARLGRRLLGALLPAAALGLGVWLAPSDAAAAPRCNSKPAVCARIANERKARPQAAPVAVVRTQQTGRVAINNSPTHCGSKPIVCARQQANGTLRVAQPPVTLARSAAAGDRCSSKPAVCARLKMKAKGAPMTLAGDDLRQVD